jgi:starch synthase
MRLFFSETKVITSVFNEAFEGLLSSNMKDKVAFDELPKEVLADYEKSTYENIMKNAIQNSDGVIIASEDTLPSLTKFIESSKKPFLPFTPKEGFAEAYTRFYKTFL